MISVFSNGSKWKVRERYAPVAIKSGITRGKAISIGIRKAMELKTELVVHYKDARVDFRHDFGEALNERNLS